MSKLYTTVADWDNGEFLRPLLKSPTGQHADSTDHTKANSFHLTIQSQILVNTDLNTRLKVIRTIYKYLLDGVGTAELKLNGFDIMIRYTDFVDSDPLCDAMSLNIKITNTNTQNDQLPIENKVVHRVLNKSGIRFRNALDDREQTDTFEEFEYEQQRV